MYCLAPAKTFFVSISQNELLSTLWRLGVLPSPPSV